MEKDKRISGIEEYKASLWIKPLYVGSKKLVGKVIEPVKVQARRPLIAYLSNLLSLAIEKSGKVELRIHVLVQLRAAQMIECSF
jgi:hypothetical protein